MSGRGTMTSRTMVSPNSMIWLMSSRSSRSITSSSTAASTIASSSSSETKGPSFSPFPGRITLVRPMRPRESSRSGPNRESAETGGAAMSAARSGCSMAQVLGAASASTKTTTTLRNVATATPHAPKSWSETMPVRVACTSWQTRTTSSTTLRNRSGCETSSTSRLAPRRPSSWRANALARVMRVSAVSASARNTEASNMTTIVTIIAVWARQRQHHRGHRGAPRSVVAPSADPVVGAVVGSEESAAQGSAARGPW